MSFIDKYLTIFVFNSSILFGNGLNAVVFRCPHRKNLMGLRSGEREDQISTELTNFSEKFFSKCFLYSAVLKIQTCSVSRNRDRNHSISDRFLIEIEVEANIFLECKVEIESRSLLRNFCSKVDHQVDFKSIRRSRIHWRPDKPISHKKITHFG